MQGFTLSCQYKQGEKSAGVHSFFPVLVTHGRAIGVGVHPFLPVSKQGGKSAGVHSFFPVLVKESGEQ